MLYLYYCTCAAVPNWAWRLIGLYTICTTETKIALPSGLGPFSFNRRYGAGILPLIICMRRGSIIDTRSSGTGFCGYRKEGRAMGIAESEGREKGRKEDNAPNDKATRPRSRGGKDWGLRGKAADRSTLTRLKHTHTFTSPTPTVENSHPSPLLGPFLTLLASKDFLSCCFQSVSVVFLLGKSFVFCRIKRS